MKQIKWALILIFLISCLPTDMQAKKKKAVFIIADGIPADVIERVQTPAIDEIASRGGYTRAYMGGEVNGITQTPTVSAVCYNCLLTSSWVNKHNVWGNDVSDPNYHYWNIFRIAENQKKEVKTAIFSSWQDNRTKLVGEGKPEAGAIKIDYVLDGLELDKQKFPDQEHSMHIFGIDEKVSTDAAACIKEQSPDLMWVYLWFMDCAGHEFGDSPFFDKYTALTDQQIARIWEAVKYREKNFDEEWMIVVTTDHGRSAKDGKGHGGQSERERTTWISTNVKPNPYFSKHQPGIVDITPSICRFMKFDIPKEVQYEQEGIPFIGKTDISNIKTEKKNDQITLTWDSYSNSPVTVYYCRTNNYKDGKPDQWEKAGTVKAGDNKFIFDCSKEPDSFYKFSLRAKNNTLTAWVKAQP